MKLKHLIASGFVALALMGCAALGINQTPTGTDALVQAEKGLTIAEDAHTAIGATLDILAKNDVLKGQNAQTALDLYIKSGEALDAAETADKAGNAQDVTSLVLQAQTLVTQIHTLTDPLKPPSPGGTP